jgi:hypothetical protein
MADRSLAGRAVGNLTDVMKTAVGGCIWATCAGVTAAALLLAHLVGRGDQLESCVLGLLRDRSA